MLFFLYFPVKVKDHDRVPTVPKVNCQRSFASL